MCIIIFAPDGKIPSKHLEESLRQNPDGWGLMWPRKGKVVVTKGLHPAHFWSAWKQRPRKQPVVFHARWKSHGAVNLDNCHPFYLDEKVHGSLAMAHNGIISECSPKKGSHKNDTRIFIEDVLNKLPKGFLEKEAFVRLIEAFVGHSKLAFMDGTGNVDILNDQYGSWHADGSWYSNTSYLNTSYLPPPKPEPKKDEPEDGYIRTLTDDDTPLLEDLFNDRRQAEWLKNLRGGLGR